MLSVQFLDSFEKHTSLCGGLTYLPKKSSTLEVYRSVVFRNKLSLTWTKTPNKIKNILSNSALSKHHMCSVLSHIDDVEITYLEYMQKVRLPDMFLSTAAKNLLMDLSVTRVYVKAGVAYCSALNNPALLVEFDDISFKFFETLLEKIKLQIGQGGETKDDSEDDSSTEVFQYLTEAVKLNTEMTDGKIKWCD